MRSEIIPYRLAVLWCRWEPHSYGYHGDDGKKFHSNGQGEDYGPQFTVGDIIGAGIHIQRQEMFFTCALSICVALGTFVNVVSSTSFWKLTHAICIIIAGRMENT